MSQVLDDAVRAASLSEQEFRVVLLSEIAAIRQIAEQSFEQTKLTNGRVTQLEKFRWMFAGAAGVLSALGVALLPKIAERVLA